MMHALSSGCGAAVKDEVFSIPFVMSGGGWSGVHVTLYNSPLGFSGFQVKTHFKSGLLDS